MLAKKKLNRLLSSLLAVIMVLGLLPTAAFAAGTDKNQIVRDGKEVVTDDGKVKHSKMIEQLGENEFKITLTIKTSEEVT